MKLSVINGIVLLCLISCTSINYRSNGKVPINFGKIEGNQIPIKIERTEGFYLWGFVPSSREVFLDDLLIEHEFTNISSLQITEKFIFSQFVASILTLGLYVPKSFILEGFSQY